MADLLKGIERKSMAKGTVKWFNAEKGYGFISDSESHRDIFVHWSQIKMEGYKQLNEKDVVEYEVEKDENTGKEKAKNVVVVEKAPAKEQ